MLSIFRGFGIELEYMIVDAQTLAVSPIADQILATAAGLELQLDQRPTTGTVSDLEVGGATWSNELALHVIELKGSQPTADLVQLGRDLELAIERIQPALQQHGVLLLPTGMHPMMKPATETKLWPHECAEIYDAYHRLFDCHTHGWANVQSVHLNLPFATDHEFGQLHAATRLVLPLLPALSASSPIVESQTTAWLDERMNRVLHHCERVPFLTGELVPEPIFDEATYRREIFEGLQSAIGPHDPEGVFDPNFLNARGAIARFDRGSIEIRVMDVQETPRADLAICVAVIGVLKSLVDRHWSSLAAQQAMPTQPLAAILSQVSEHADTALIDNRQFLDLLGVRADAISAVELWRHLLETAESYEPMLKQFAEPLEQILSHGPLARRILRSVGEDEPARRLAGGKPEPSWQGAIKRTYREIGNALNSGRLFLP